MMRARTFVVLAAAGFLWGCAGKPTPAPPPRETVSGKVVARNRPVAFVLVTFHPVDPADPNRYDAPADRDGSFTVECPKGSYKVTINPLPVGPGGDAAGGNLSGADAGGLKEVPRQFRTKTDTTLTRVVPAGGLKDVIFTLN